MTWIHRAGSGIVRLHARITSPAERERGDVPGWVMITLMTAVIVVLIWGIASDQLKNLINSAFSQVNNQNSGGGGS
jgi:hypothetical protein